MGTTLVASLILVWPRDNNTNAVSRKVVRATSGRLPFWSPFLTVTFSCGGLVVLGGSVEIDLNTSENIVLRNAKVLKFLD